MVELSCLFGTVVVDKDAFVGRVLLLLVTLVVVKEEEEEWVYKGKGDV